MDFSPHTYPTDRLIDYFCVAGPGEELSVSEGGCVSTSTPSGKFHPFKTEFCPHILDRYPLTDFKDTPFPTGVASFCFPMGVRMRRPKPPAEPLPSFFVFVATGAKGDHVYGHVLTFWERTTPAQESAFDTSVGAASADSGPFFAPKCFCILTRWNLPAFRAVLTEMYRISLSPNPIPMERYLCNLVSEVALPPAGKVEVEYELGYTKITFRRPPKNRRVSAFGLPFREVFECLDLDNVLKLVRCILTEKQILFVSSQLTLLTAAAEVLCSLIYPFKWPHTVIPVLPKALLPVVHSPVPYIVGMHLDQYREFIDEIPSWTVQVNLDANTIITDPAMTVPHFPSKQATKLLRSLRANANVFAYRGEDWRYTRLPNFDSAFDFAVRPDEVDEVFASDMGDDNDQASSSDDERGGVRGGLLGSLGGYVAGGSRRSGVRVNWHATRRAFFRLFVSLMLRYREFLNVPGNRDVALGRFSKRAFLDSQPRDARAFLEEIMNTQLFADFIDDRLQAEQSDVDVDFFDQSIDAKINRSRLTFTKRPTPFLDSREFLSTRTAVAYPVQVKDLPGYPARLYTYSPFPRLDVKLFVTPREVQNFADTAPRGMGGMASRVRSLARRMSTALVPLAARSTEQNIYTAWFIMFGAAIDIAADIVAERAGVAFDEHERRKLRQQGRLITANAYALISAAAADAGASSTDGAAILPTASPAQRGTSVSSLPPVAPVVAVPVSNGPAIRGGARVGSVAAALATGAAPQVAVPSVTSTGYVSGNPVFTLPPELAATSTPPAARPARERTSSTGGPAPARASIMSAPVTSFLRQSSAGVAGTAGGGYTGSPQPTARSGPRSPTILRRDAAIAAARGMFLSRVLEVGFGVLERMKADGVKADEFIYETLLEACSKTGNFGRANVLLSEMSEAGLAGDARLYRHYFQAFFHSQPEGAAAGFQLPHLQLRRPLVRGPPGAAQLKPASSMHNLTAGAATPVASTEGSLQAARRMFGFTNVTASPPRGGATVATAPASPAHELERRGSAISSVSPARAATAAPSDTGFTPATASPPQAVSTTAALAPRATVSSWSVRMHGMWPNQRAALPRAPRPGSAAASMLEQPPASAGHHRRDPSDAPSAAVNAGLHDDLPASETPTPMAAGGSSSAMLHKIAEVSNAAGTSIGSMAESSAQAIASVTTAAAQWLLPTSPASGTSVSRPLASAEGADGPSSLESGRKASSTGSLMQAVTSSVSNAMSNMLSPLAQSDAATSGIAEGNRTTSTMQDGEGRVRTEQQQPADAASASEAGAPTAPLADAPVVAAASSAHALTAADPVATPSAEKPAAPPAESAPTSAPLEPHASSYTGFTDDEGASSSASGGEEDDVDGHDAEARDRATSLPKIAGAVDPTHAQASSGASAGVSTNQSARPPSGSASGNFGFDAVEEPEEATLPVPTFVLHASILDRPRAVAFKSPVASSTTPASSTGTPMAHATPSSTGIARSISLAGSRASEHAPVSARNEAASRHEIVEIEAVIFVSPGLPTLTIVSPPSVTCIGHRFPNLAINTMRETCPECNRALTDADIRAGWTKSEQQYTTVCPFCPADAKGQRRKFVARFSVSSSAPYWRGSVQRGAGALLFCEYLPPAVLVKELQQSIGNGAFAATLRAKTPSIFWNMLLWFTSFALPLELLEYLACEESPEDENGVLRSVLTRLTGKGDSIEVPSPPPRAAAEAPPSIPSEQVALPADSAVAAVKQREGAAAPPPLAPLVVPNAATLEAASTASALASATGVTVVSSPSQGSSLGAASSIATPYSTVTPMADGHDTDIDALRDLHASGASSAPARHAQAFDFGSPVVARSSPILTSIPEHTRTPELRRTAPGSPPLTAMSAPAHGSPARLRTSSTLSTASSGAEAATTAPTTARSQHASADNESEPAHGMAAIVDALKNMAVASTGMPLM